MSAIAVLKRPFLTLKAQTLVTLTTIFILSHLFSLMIYESNRHRTVMLTEAADLADQIISIVDLALQFPPADRIRILNGAQTQFLSMYPEAALATEDACEQNEFAARITDRLNNWFGLYAGLDASVCMGNIRAPAGFLRRLTPAASGYDALVYIDFPDSEQSVFRARLPEAPSLFRDIAMFYIVLAGVISLLIAWLLISRVLIPLGQLATAADGIGVNLDAPSLPEDGPSEVARAARAFNRMQARLKRLVHGQTEMLAAVSHDLRSAATRLQLRAELLDNEAEREGMMRVVSDMRHMIESVLDFARGVEPNETSRRTDVIALLESMVSDLQDEGFPVTLVGGEESLLMPCRPVSLRRGFQNLIDNAVKYGEKAVISYEIHESYLRIIFKDNGPGVDASELQNILRPFYRLEASRNRDNGGIGLGLAIVQNAVQLHGGQVRVANRDDGRQGLQVEILLPVEV